MPRGASPKRENEYKKLERKFKKEGRYAGREEEVASRIVNKQRAASGEASTSTTAKHRHKPASRTASRRKSRKSHTTRSRTRTHRKSS